ncbi:hypothetical protein [Streptomyces marispadix]|uniref:Flp pilus assembly protein RcpC/CpaB domain-containing protein n=1 Tax=Streptomyces marispadix TaxID=2922868 RepID=A0ABS9SWY8_9ACTN|nr:hypothetical protein [Streptomyces marispadix]MCH6160794.1 hypothetical protein [Streptomyces marispadix]
MTDAPTLRRQAVIVMARRLGSRGGGAGGIHGDGDHGSRPYERRDRPGPVPGRCVVADITPIRPRSRGRHRLRRITRGRRRVTAAGLAVAAAALSGQIARADRPAPAPTESARKPAGSPTAVSSQAVERAPGAGRRTATVSVPVRIADAGAVRLLRPGDHVDVISGADGTESSRVVARGARVDRLPGSVETGPVGAADGGALVVLRVPRGTATALAGAGAAGRLAVTLC